MADGTFAVLMFVAGLTDMSLNYCNTSSGCLGRAAVVPRVGISAGEWVERNASPQGEVYLRYDFGVRRGPFRTVAGLSVAESGETWAGIGNTYFFNIGDGGLYGELHAMPGVYFDNGGFDLGGEIVFRSGIELGFEDRSGWRYALTYDHRSNAGLYDDNPGVETVQFKVSVPLQ